MGRCVQAGRIEHPEGEVLLISCGRSGTGKSCWKLTIFYPGLANHRNASWICCRCATYSLILTSIAFPPELSGPRLHRTHPISVPILSSNIHDAALPSLVYISIDSLTVSFTQYGSAHNTARCSSSASAYCILQQTLAPY